MRSVLPRRSSRLPRCHPSRRRPPAERRVPGRVRNRVRQDRPRRPGPTRSSRRSRRRRLSSAAERGGRVEEEDGRDGEDVRGSGEGEDLPGDLQIAVEPARGGSGGWSDREGEGGVRGSTGGLLGGMCVCAGAAGRPGESFSDVRRKTATRTDAFRFPVSFPQDWTSYLELGPESWKRIGNSAAKRQVGIRFLYNVGMLDPSAYEVRCVYSPSSFRFLLFVPDLLLKLCSPSKSTTSPFSSKPSPFLPPASPSSLSSSRSCSTSTRSGTSSPTSRSRRTRRRAGSCSFWSCSRSREWISFPVSPSPPHSEERKSRELTRLVLRFGSSRALRQHLPRTQPDRYGQPDPPAEEGLPHGVRAGDAGDDDRSSRGGSRPFSPLLFLSLRRAQADLFGFLAQTLSGPARAQYIALCLAVREAMQERAGLALNENVLRELRFFSGLR